MIEKPEFTKGPWAVRRSKMATDGAFDYAISADGAPVIAEAFGRDAKGGWPASEANAALIAAAPDMFNELDVRVGDLVMLRRAIEEGDPKAELLIRIDDMLRETRAALSKALGKDAP